MKKKTKVKNKSRVNHKKKVKTIGEKRKAIENGKKGGRPKFIIDWSKWDVSLHAGVSGAMIASKIGISPDTLYRRCKEDHKIGFAEYSALKRTIGLDLLKLAQYTTAIKGNVVMQIFLGKNYLGQSDKIENINKNFNSIFDEINDEIEEGNELKKETHDRHIKAEKEKHTKKIAVKETKSEGINIKKKEVVKKRVVRIKRKHDKKK